MRLRSVDLNLLVALNALLEERHVSRAALRVGLSQPAMSNALARLRATFGDDLLVRTPRGMEPTTRGLELADQVRQVLRQVERVLTPDSGFNPSRCEHRFVLRMSDLLSLLFLPAIARALLHEAPLAALEVVHLSPAQTVQALEADGCDLALSMGLAHGGSIARQALLPDRMVCVMRQAHPSARGRLDLERLLALQHLRVSISPVDSRFVDDALTRMGRSRRVAANVPHWLVVPEVLRATDLVAVMPERLADVLAREADGFARRDLPLPETAFEWALYWHRRHEGSAQHAWLRGLVMRAIGTPRSRASSVTPTKPRPSPPVPAKP
ncbi:LysR family transcriptional regulator [Sabulicella rubraurantiaca]|uniref:LysR family transcriptional regulator n=1 Tax=Sabulicella rubraurantiaca TaxID=2811429 RepID=UPI001A96E565|nr:LysR family transcriptional regulator [Sabulicella rubraurantiaca]